MVVPRTNSETEHQSLIHGGLVTDQGSFPTPTGPTTFSPKFAMYWVATAGALTFTLTVWYVIFTAEYIFFIWHPFLMSATLFLLTQGILLLQRTETREEKGKGLDLHRSVQSLAFLAGLVTSAHGISGAVTLSLMLIQVLAGAAIVNFPGLFGGVAQAKGFYKYHRISGYIIIFFAWFTALGGTQADWTKAQFDNVWLWLSAVIITWVGVGSRIRLHKLKKS
ncbi:hypothetical protein G9A89_018628 [Geosiphon pyriformis]|nr:hypothetical protein G9A89_018628 [Geosiphon pyriformis]